MICKSHLRLYHKKISRFTSDSKGKEKFMSPLKHDHNKDLQ
jgi:hypothetical protein